MIQYNIRHVTNGTLGCNIRHGNTATRDSYPPLRIPELVLRHPLAAVPSKSRSSRNTNPMSKGARMHCVALDRFTSLFLLHLPGREPGALLAPPWRGGAELFRLPRALLADGAKHERQEHSDAIGAGVFPIGQRGALRPVYLRRGATVRI